MHGFLQVWVQTKKEITHMYVRWKNVANQGGRDAFSEPDFSQFSDG